MNVHEVPCTKREKSLHDTQVSVHWSAAKNDERPWPRSCIGRQALVVLPDLVAVIFNPFMPPAGDPGRLLTLFGGRSENSGLGRTIRPSSPSRTRPARSQSGQAPAWLYVRFLDSTRSRI